MDKKKVGTNPSRVQSKRPAFRILKTVTFIALGIIMILAIISILIKYYQLVFEK